MDQYITYNKNYDFSYTFLFNRLIILVLSILYILNLFLETIPIFISSLIFFIVSILLFIKDMLDNKKKELASINGFKIFILINLLNQNKLIKFFNPISELELSLIHEILDEINRYNVICTIQQIYYEPDDRNLINSISIKINDISSLKASINPIENNYFDFFKTTLNQYV